MTIRIAIIGFGKIARDQHVPAIAADPRFELVAVTSRSADPAIGVPCHDSLDALLTAMPDRVDAVAIATPPDARHPIARRALDAGLAVLLEKPPAATLGEAEDLVALAEARGCSLYAGWHSQHAPAVAPAAELLRGQQIRRLDIVWHEDVRKWHPGQEWIWQPGGFGVFDPGINALSIASAILPERLMVRDAAIEVPANRQAPIAATLSFAAPDHRASFDWRHSDGEAWSIAIETEAGMRIELADGGARLSINGVAQPLDGTGEYRSLYNRFATLLAIGGSEVDLEPLRIVADAFLVARRDAAAPFEWTRQS